MLANLLNDCQGGEYHPSAGYIEYVPEEGGSYDMDANADEPTKPSGYYDEDDEWWEDSGESWSDGSEEFTATEGGKLPCYDKEDNSVPKDNKADENDLNCSLLEENSPNPLNKTGSCFNNEDDDQDDMADIADPDCHGMERNQPGAVY